MRHGVALIIVSWVVGIIEGAFHAPYALVALSICTLVLWGAQLHLRKQYWCAILFLILIGFLYASHIQNYTQVPCVSADNEEATLTRTYAISPTESRYVFTRKDGCSLLVYAPRFPLLARGTLARITGKQETPQEAFASIPEYGEFLVDDGISFVVRNAHLEVTHVGNAFIDVFRLRAMATIQRLFPEPDSSLLVAMLVGDQGMISQDIKEIYRNSGITHILSISGLHISIIALVLSFAIGKMPIPGAVRSLIISFLLWIYIVGVGAPASAIRAGIFWTLYVLGYHVRALIGLLTVVLFALAILLTLDPTLARAIGFELSVLAVSGIGVALFFLRRAHLPPIIKPIVTLCAVSAGATFATAPLTLYYFGNLSFVGLITNMLVVPLLPLITYLALIAMSLSFIAMPVALALAFIVHVLMGWVLFVAKILAGIPYGHIEGLQFSAWAVGVYYVAMGLSIIGAMKYLKISWRQWWI